jgi:hypothetical protein
LQHESGLKSFVQFHGPALLEKSASANGLKGLTEQSSEPATSPPE